MKVLILKGGTSNEREVSLRSGDAIAAACREAGFEIEEFDTQFGLKRILDHTVDVVFPALHGAGGEDGAVQQFLESHKMPYVGSGPEACRTTFDKSIFLEKAANASIVIPKGAIVNKGEFRGSQLASAPFVLKPINGGSSLDTFIVRSGNAAEVPDGIFDIYPQMILEQLIEGSEITVSILGDEALPVIEIVPPEGEEFDYENKYNGKTNDVCPPVSVSEEVQKESRRIALDIHKLFGCRHLSRVDFIVGDNNDIYALELNTLPGFTNQSLYPVAAKEAGYSMSELVKKLISMAKDSSL